MIKSFAILSVICALCSCSGMSEAQKTAKSRTAQDRINQSQSGTNSVFKDF